jgi:arylsulfatase
MECKGQSAAGVGNARMRFSTWLLVAASLAGPIGCRPEVERPSLLIFLTVDTLRADRVGAFGGELGLTPNLDALADESLVFTSAYAPTSLTLPSVSSMMTGRYPSELGIWSNESGLPASTPTLAGELKSRGWRTFAVVGNFVLRRGSGLDSGFDHYDDSFRDREAVRGLPERTAADNTDAGLAMFDLCTAGEDTRCLVWIHYQDPHGPYTPTDERRARYLPIEREAVDGRRVLPVRQGVVGIGGIPNYQYLDEQREVAFYRAGYDAEVSYMDEEVGRLLDGLEKRGLMDNALIVFAADHGESLGERDYWFAHGEYLSEVLVRVPFFLRVPGRAPGRRGDVVSLVDLFGTILRQLTGELDVPGHRGRDLLAEGAADGASVAYLETRGASTLQRHGIVDGEYKWIVSERGDVPTGTLYRVWRSDIGVESERPESNQLELEQAMSERLDALTRSFDRDAPEIRQEFSDADRERLRALGYAAESPSSEGGSR